MQRWWRLRARFSVFMTDSAMLCAAVLHAGVCDVRRYYRVVHSCGAAVVVR
jgi:hypothetical protein